MRPQVNPSSSKKDHSHCSEVAVQSAGSGHGRGELTRVTQGPSAGKDPILLDEKV